MKDKRVYLFIEMGSLRREDSTESEFKNFFRFIHIGFSGYKNVYGIIV